MPSLLGLGALYRKEKKVDSDYDTVIEYCAKSFQPFLLRLLGLNPKKRRGKFFGLLDVYRFRSIKITTNPITTSTAMAAPPRPKTYASVIGATVGVGAGVTSGASSTFIAVSA